VCNDNQSFTINYTENIAAAYGIASANLGRWSLVAGLRGEYTHTRGKGGDISQNYFSLFPNANVSYALTKDGAYSLIAQYARTIERPRFWSLNPQRFQISDYTYQTGNPELDPAYKQDISLTLVLKHKYTLTGGMTIQRDEIQQTIRPDADDPARLCLAWTNFDTTKNYYLTANAPFQFTKWWTMNLNLTYIRQGQRIDEHSAEKHYNFYFVNSSTTFSLPAKFYIDLSYRFQSRMDFGNCWVKPLHFLNAGIKKRFGDKFTASFSVRNLIERPQHIGARGDGSCACRRQTAVERPQLHDRSDLQLQVGQSLQTQGGRSGFGRREKPPVKFPGQHHGTRDTRPRSHDPKHNIPERTQHRGTQHPQTCTAGHSIAGYNPDRVTGNTATFVVVK